VAATSAPHCLDRLAGVLRALSARLAGMRTPPFAVAARMIGGLAGVLSVGHGHTAELPENRADLLFHRYDGGGVEAWGPALLVRKDLLNKVSLFASYYADILSNASIDVVTTASPYDETRHEYGVGFDYAVRDSLITVSATTSDEPDYKADALSVDVTTETFSGMTSVSLGYTYGRDEVGRTDEGFFDRASHWRYRFGVTQILTPRWLASANFEVVSDDGYLGNPYRAARVFGAAVPERVPRTRTSRALKFRAIGEIAPALSLRGEYRYFWDTWDIKAHTFDLGLTRRFGQNWLVDGYLRGYRQDGALFYSDNASSETLYVTRNRQLSDYGSYAIGTKATWTWLRAAGRYDVRVSGALEYSKTDYDNFTDVRDGSAYSYNATVVQLFVSATY
jgi:hypothetical protein